MYRMVLEWNESPQSGVANNPCQGSGRRLGTGAKRECTKGTFLSAAYVVTVMIKTWLGATYRTDALCRSLSLHFCISLILLIN